MTAFEPLSLHNLFALDLPPVDYAVDNLVPLGAATLFSAREKAGKGLFTLDLCASIAFEEPFLGRAVQPGAAIYCAAEENIRDVRARIEARIGMRRDGPLYVLRLDGSTDDRLDLSDAVGVGRLLTMIQDTQPVVVVLDVLRELHNGREDSSDDMAPLLRPLRSIAHDQNVALVVNHHMNRGSTFRGSTAIAAAFDVVMEISPEDVPLGEPITAALKVNGRGGRQQLRIKLGDGLRWAPVAPTITIGEETIRARILTVLERVEGGADAETIARELSTSGVTVALRTVQNSISQMLKEGPPPIVAEGRGVRGAPRRYRLPQSRLFPQDGDPLGGREYGNSRNDEATTHPEVFPEQWERCVGGIRNRLGRRAGMIANVIAAFERAGVFLYLQDGELRARARPGELTPDVRETIAVHREALTDELQAIDATVQCVRAQPADVRDAWRREIVAWQRWEEAGHPPEPNQAHDLAALRRIVPPGVCLDCGGPAPNDGRYWCAACERKPGSQTSGGV